MQKFKSYLFSATALLASQVMHAQCAMCKAVLESDSSRDGAIAGRGVNDGILYLMAFPYVLMFAVVIYIFRDHLAQALGLQKSRKIGPA